jgi:general secretion pathway protein B
LSYLLETLKRLEEERRQEGESDLLKVQGKTVKPRKKTPLWPYFLSAALLLNAGIGLWWLLPGQHVTPGVTAQSPGTGEARPNEPSPAAIPAKTVDAPPSEDRSAAGKAQSAARDRAGAARPGTIREGGDAGSSGPKEAVRRAPATLSAPPVSSASSKPAGAKPAPERVETAATDAVSNNDKNRTGPLKISLHSYGPARDSRLVRINDRTLREGETLSPGIKVEEITPDGVILNRDGQRLHLGINEEH